MRYLPLIFLPLCVSLLAPAEAHTLKGKTARAAAERTLHTLSQDFSTAAGDPYDELDVLTYVWVKRCERVTPHLVRCLGGFYTGTSRYRCSVLVSVSFSRTSTRLRYCV